MIIRLSHKLSTKIKGVSQQIELVLALLLGYLVLDENIGTDGLVGCSILVASYVTGVMCAEKAGPAIEAPTRARNAV